MRNIGEVLSIFNMVGAICDLCHRFNTNYAFDSQIGLVPTTETSARILGRRVVIIIRKWASEVISTDLVHRNERVFDQIVVPLLQNIVVLCEVGVMVCPLSISEGHNNNIATLFKRLHSRQHKPRMPSRSLNLGVGLYTHHHLRIVRMVACSIWKQGSKIVDTELIRPVSRLLMDE